jgi:leucyl aminopeptidase (aminopeptidase T)
MENDIAVSISWNKESNEILFIFREDENSKVIGEFGLTPKQLLQVFQYSGVDFFED